MKKIIVGMLAISLAFSATAQNNKKQDSKERKFGRKEHSQHLKHPQVAKRLDLTTEQSTKINSINESYKERMKDLKKQDDITVKEQKDRRAALAKEHKESVEAILTPEQKKQLDESKKDAKVKDNKRVEHLNKRLDLTDAQGARIKEVNQDFRTKTQEVQKNESLSREQKKEQLKSLRQTHTEQIKSILTEEQKNKLEALKRNKSDRRTGK